ncbi:MAG: hypothetical protein LUG83_03085 [Lachnospiraceae bacterium]|nr:hypothetical protein [Lachnospiraceae bacterium]
MNSRCMTMAIHGRECCPLAKRGLQVDSLLQEADARSRNEFVNQALKFYIGYLI